MKSFYLLFFSFTFCCCNSVKEGYISFSINNSLRYDYKATSRISGLFTPTFVYIEVLSNGFFLVLEDSVASKNDLKTPLKKNSKNFKFICVIPSPIRKGELINFSTEDCANLSGIVNITEIDLKKKKLSGNFEVIVCGEKGDKQIIIGSFYKLDIYD